MIKQSVSVGDLVTYHGSLPGYNGIDFIIEGGYADKDGRGYLLCKADEYKELYPVRLMNVHRDSFTLKEANVHPRGPEPLRSMS